MTPSSSPNFSLIYNSVKNQSASSTENKFEIEFTNKLNFKKYYRDQIKVRFELYFKTVRKGKSYNVHNKDEPQLL